jgi:hypothetical protein
MLGSRKMSPKEIAKKRRGGKAAKEQLKEKYGPENVLRSGIYINPFTKNRTPYRKDQ